MVSLTFTTLCCCFYTDQWMGGDMHKSSGHIDHAKIEQFQHGDFVDQTQHVKNAFCFCMLTPHGLCKQDMAEEGYKEQQHALSKDISL